MPLHSSVRHNDHTLTHYLLDNKADVNIQTKKQRNTALHLVVCKMTTTSDLLLLILAYQPRLEDQNKSSQTPLLCAVEAANDPAVAILLNRSANPNCENKFKSPPIIIACDGLYQMGRLKNDCLSDPNKYWKPVKEDTPLRYERLKNIIKLLVQNPATSSSHLQVTTKKLKEYAVKLGDNSLKELAQESEKRATVVDLANSEKKSPPLKKRSFAYLKNNHQ